MAGWLKWTLALLLIGSLGVTSGPALAQSPGEGEIVEAGMPGSTAQLLAADEDAVTFRVQVPWQQLQVETIAVEGATYAAVALPGWAALQQPGAPALPAHLEALGAPLGAEVAVEVTPGPAHIVPLPAPVMPAARQELDWELPDPVTGELSEPTPRVVIEPDPAIYDDETSFPQALAVLSNDGMLRQQRVLGVEARPVQYAPTRGELTIYEWLQVTVRFGGAPMMLQSAEAESPVYEGLLTQNLLNADAARAWRVATGAAALGVAAEGVSGAATPWAPPDPGWRVLVRADGLYELTYDELRDALLPVDTLDPATLQVFHLGEEVAIEVTGAGDGGFDSGDAVIFYGQDIDDKYTADNVYWLTYGHAAGLRMGVRDGTPGAADAPDHYAAELWMEDSLKYITLAPGDEYLERWLWQQLYRTSSTTPKTWDYPFTLTAPYDGSGTLTVAMLGYVQNAINPDHHVTIGLNGATIGNVWWDGVTWQVSEMPVPAALLHAGVNTITVAAQPDTGLSYDLIYIDRMALTYSRSLAAEGNALAFSYDQIGARLFEVAGFEGDLVGAYDVSAPLTPVRIANVETVSAGGGRYTARFQDTLAAPTEYVALTLDPALGAYQDEQAIEADTPSNLADVSNGADHIIITHSDFAAAVAPLHDHRASGGLRAVQVDVQDVYDEFGYGIAGAAPIRAFLAYTYDHWQAPAPTYVVLVGDGNYDPKHHVYDRVSYLPPYLAPVDPWIGETAADNRYVTLAGADRLPDMIISRLSVNSAAEASAMVSKILAYEQTPVPGAWQQQVLAVADNADSAGNFPVISDNLLSDCLPSPYTAIKVYYGIAPHTTVASARAAIQSEFIAGKLLVNFVGHAYRAAWANEDLLMTTDVPLLVNEGRHPVVLAMTCREGQFQEPGPYTTESPGEEALGEVVTRAQGRGAVASWSPTGLGVASGHDHLNRGFYDALFTSGTGIVGQAVAAGKLRLFLANTSPDLLDTYMLFGDSATRMPLVPTDVSIHGLTATADGHDIVIAWRTTHETDIIGFNLWRGADPQGADSRPINEELIPAANPGGSGSADYRYVDASPEVCTTSYYWLEVIGADATSARYGPVSAEAWCLRSYHPVLSGAGPLVNLSSGDR